MAGESWQQEAKAGSREITASSANTKKRESNEIGVRLQTLKAYPLLKFFLQQDYTS